MPVTPINSMEEYTTTIKFSNPVIIFFYINGSEECDMISSVLEHMSDQPGLSGGVTTMCKVDVQGAPDVAQEAGMRPPPSLILFKDGNKVNECMGGLDPLPFSNLVLQDKMMV